MTLQDVTNFMGAVLCLALLGTMGKKLAKTLALPQVAGTLNIRAKPIMTGPGDLPKGTSIGKPEKIVIHIPEEEPKKREIPTPEIPRREPVPVPVRREPVKV